MVEQPYGKPVGFWSLAANLGFVWLSFPGGLWRFFVFLSCRQSDNSWTEKASLHSGDHVNGGVETRKLVMFLC
jgi:hypothetical protein